MSFEFEGHEIPAGSSEWVELSVTEDADMSDLSIPVYVVHGGDGPVLWMQGCVHGSEHSGALAIRDVVQDLSPADVSGTIVAVPVVNRSAFANKQRASPIDGKDLNRNFPGNEAGTFSERLAARLFSSITDHADFVVDFHTGGNEFLIPGYSIFAPTDDEVEQQCRAMCRASDLPYAARVSLDTFPGATYGELATRGIPAIVTEVGGEGRIREHHLERTTRIVRNIPRHLGLLEDDPDRENDVAFRDRIDILRADVGGFFECTVTGNEPVAEGDHLARITDIKGNIKEEFVAPYDAVLVAVQTYGSVRPGDWTFELVPA